MRSTASDIVASRRTVQGVARVVGAAIVVYGLSKFVERIEFHIFMFRSAGRVGIWQNIIGFFKDSVYFDSFFVIVIGVFFVLRSGWIARIATPSQTMNACPKCRFSLENFRADRCPECGLYLGPDFHAPPPAPSEPAP